MQPIRNIWRILVGDNPGIMHVGFGEIRINGSKEEVVWTYPIYNSMWNRAPGAGSILTPGAYLNNFGRGPHDDAI